MDCRVGGAWAGQACLARQVGQASPATAAVTAPLAPGILGNLRLNEPARRLFGSLRPATTPVIHFTFGSGAMLDFLRNWLHYVRRAGLEPAVAGAADAQMLAACSKEGIAALGIVEGIDQVRLTKEHLHVSLLIIQSRNGPRS